MSGNNMDIKDGAFKSRKFLLTIIGLFLVTFVGIIGIKYPSVLGLYPTFIGGILGVLGLYFGGNVINKHVIGSNQAKIEAMKDGSDE